VNVFKSFKLGIADKPRMICIHTPWMTMWRRQKETETETETSGQRDRERERVKGLKKFVVRGKNKIGLELVINDKHEESIYNLHQSFYKLLQIALIASLIQTEACGRGGGGARPHTNLFTGLKWR
jgi:hypothetical protein